MRKIPINEIKLSNSKMTSRLQRIAAFTKMYRVRVLYGGHTQNDDVVTNCYRQHRAHKLLLNDEHTHTHNILSRDKRETKFRRLLYPRYKIEKNDRHDFNETYFSHEHDYQSAHIVDVYEKQDYK